MNDVLTLNIHNGEGGNAPIAWHSLTPVIQAMEALATRTAEVLRNSYLRTPMPETQPGGQGARLLIAGPPRRGSIVLPFALELPVTLNILGMSGRSTMASLANPLSDYLGSLADLATLATFVRDVVFGSRGLIARRTDQINGEPDGSREGEALELAAGFLAAVTPQIERLLEAAEATGCDQLEVQVNDQTAVKLIMNNRRRRSGLLARAPKPVWHDSSRPPLAYYFDPADLQPMQRRSDSSLDVEYDGQRVSAILLHMTSPTDQAIVALWGAKLDLPNKGETVEIRGRVVDKRDVTPMADVPQEFELATDVFWVDSARPSWR